MMRKVAFVIVPGLLGRNLSMVERLQDELEGLGKVSVFEHDHLGSVKSRSEKLAHMLERLRASGAEKIVLLGHSLGGYIVRQLRPESLKNVAAFISLSSAPHAKHLLENVRRAKRYLTGMRRGGGRADKAFDEKNLTQKYNPRAIGPNVPTLHIRQIRDRLAMPKPWDNEQRKKKQGHVFVVVRPEVDPTGSDVWKRHNWQHLSTQRELIERIKEFLKEKGIPT
ncbi:MAG TPA: alpha/beta fold hydrolase [Candidatus Norongarragalinales archaeon]|nr:alpha/beta fold hydrolase [Candidatus Norongarragalinales archaeon]